MSRLARNISANVLSNGWSTVLSLVLTPLYLKYLGVESFGLIGFYMSWIALLGVIDTAISATAIRETAWMAARPDERARIPSLIRTLEIAYWGLLLAVGVVLLAVAAWAGARWFEATTLEPSVVRTALMCMVVSLVVQVPAGLYIAGLMGLQRQVEASALVTIFGTLRGLGAVAVLLLVAADIRVFFLWQIAASALQVATTRARLARATRIASEPARFSMPMLASVRQFAGETSVVTAVSLVLAQGDKMILSRLVSLETLGYYMVAWTVASGLSRIATPLLQAFGPRFTELVSSGDDEGLARQLRTASQLLGVLILPPAALIAIVAEPILRAWTNAPLVARAAAPLLTVLAAGTVLSACSYAPLSVLYSRKRLRPVIVLNLACVVVILPALGLAVFSYGAMGAAVCWFAYGLTVYVGCQVLGLRGLPRTSVAQAILRDFVAPAVVAVALALVARGVIARLDNRLAIALACGVALTLGWCGALAVCRDVARLVASSFRWTSLPTPWSA